MELVDIHISFKIPKGMQTPEGQRLPNLEKLLGTSQKMYAPAGLPGPAVFVIRDNLIEYLKGKGCERFDTGGGLGEYNIDCKAPPERVPEIEVTIRAVLAEYAVTFTVDHAAYPA